MNDEKSKAGEIKKDGLQSVDGVNELRTSPDRSPDGDLSEAVAHGADLEPELESPMDFQASSQCSDCPDELAEEVYLGRAQPEAATLFHAHLETCSKCRQVYEETVQYIEALRAAAQTLESVDGSTIN